MQQLTSVTMRTSITTQIDGSDTPGPDDQPRVRTGRRFTLLDPPAERNSWPSLSLLSTSSSDSCWPHRCR
jgi:hypothetical protein